MWWRLLCECELDVVCPDCPGRDGGEMEDVMKKLEDIEVCLHARGTDGVSKKMADRQEY